MNENDIPNGYSQECHFGYLRDSTEEEKLTMGNRVVECHNHLCPEKYCKYSFYTGFQIEDSNCPYFSINRR